MFKTGFEFYLVIMVSVIVFLMLILIVILDFRMSRIAKKLDKISRDASEFLRLGLSHFKSKKK